MMLDSIKLRKIREKNKLSQFELAEQLGLSQTTIHEWEKSDHDVKLEYVLKISELFGINIHDLSKDGTTININNQLNNKAGNNSNIGFQIDAESLLLQKELINTLKENNSFLKEENKRLKDQIKSKDPN